MSVYSLIHLFIHHSKFIFPTEINNTEIFAVKALLIYARYVNIKLSGNKKKMCLESLTFQGVPHIRPGNWISRCPPAP